MNKVLLIDQKPLPELPNDSKVISFFSDNYISVDSYITENELADIYDKTYSVVYSWLNKYKEEKTFTFENADILWAYGKNIFDYIFSLYRKIYIVNKIMEKESPEELWLLKDKNNKESCLSSFLFDFIEENTPIKYIPVREAKTKSNVKRTSSNVGWFLRFCTKPLRYLAISKKKSTDNILIHSDLDKMIEILPYLKEKNVLFLRKELPERLLFNFFKNGIGLILFSDFKLTNEKKKQIVKAYENFINNLKEPIKGLKIDKYDFTPYVKNYILNSWRKELPDILATIVQAGSLLNNFQPNSLLLDEDRTVINNLLAQITKQYNCKSYVNCHGEPYLKIGYLPLTSDWMVVWGKAQKELFSSWGLDEERIIISGSTKHQAHSDLSRQAARDLVCKGLKISKDKLIVLIGWCALGRREDIRKKFAWDKIKEAIKTVSDFKDIQIIIKLHPGDTEGSLVEEFIKTINVDSIIILRKYDPLFLAKACDLLIVYGSTFAIDGLAYDKPVILLDTPTIERYSSLNFFYTANNEEELKKSITDIIDGKDKRYISNYKTALDYCLNGDGNIASKHVAERILKK